MVVVEEEDMEEVMEEEAVVEVVVAFRGLVGPGVTEGVTSREVAMAGVGVRGTE